MWPYKDGTKLKGLNIPIKHQTKNNKPKTKEKKGIQPFTREKRKYQLGLKQSNIYKLTCSTKQTTNKAPKSTKSEVEHSETKAFKLKVVLPDDPHPYFLCSSFPL